MSSSILGPRPDVCVGRAAAYHRGIASVQPIQCTIFTEAITKINRDYVHRIPLRVILLEGASRGVPYTGNTRCTDSTRSASTVPNWENLKPFHPSRKSGILVFLEAPYARDAVRESRLTLSGASQRQMARTIIDKHKLFCTSMLRYISPPGYGAKRIPALAELGLFAE